MHSILSRHPSTSTSSHRAPRKSSSFLSLRREKEKPPPPPNSYPSTSLSSHNPTHPSSSTSLPSTRNPKSKAHRSSLSQSSPVHSQGISTTSSAVQITGSIPREAESYTFPTLDAVDNVLTPVTDHPPRGSYSRTRSITGPSGRSDWDGLATASQLRFSGSSSTQYTETPPKTPTDYSDSTDSLEQFPVVVAAPVSGVEMMDALVDGMNGGSSLPSQLRLSGRSRFDIRGHHPLYQPPLPTPPPGVVLGGGKPRRSKGFRPTNSSDSGEDEDSRRSQSASRPRRRKPRSSGRTPSTSTITAIPSTSCTPSKDKDYSVPSSYVAINSSASSPSFSSETRKSIVPSISDIIKAHSPLDVHARSRPSTGRTSSLYSSSHTSFNTHDLTQHDIHVPPTLVTGEEDLDLISRSSIDSVADEVQQTLRNQGAVQRAPSAPPSAFLQRRSIISDNASIRSPRSDPGRASSVHSSSAASSYYPSSPLDAAFISLTVSSPSQEVARYLRSTRLTTLLKLTRSPHASRDNPLTVSLSDLGSPTGYPVLVFLGLGCVRHIMGLYDEMAECMNLRLITIDRWGLGRTDSRSKSERGIRHWSYVVEEVLDLLGIDQCSIMAHSAGAPYALSFANKVPSRIRGDIYLLAPWVGGSDSSGYKWLKYVPNGILKTAQAAEWKLQTWMIGKPPSVSYQGIGYIAPSSTKESAPRSTDSLNAIYPSNTEEHPRPSMASSSFSEYDDLHDFEGRFESRSTLGTGSHSSPAIPRSESASKMFLTKRKSSRSFLERLKGSSTSPESISDGKVTSKGLKALKSMGSLKGKTRVSKGSEPSSPQFPPSLQLEVGLGYEHLQWPKQLDLDSQSNQGSQTSPGTPRPSSQGEASRTSGRRSISFTSSRIATSMPSSPSPSSASLSFGTVTATGAGDQALLGNALIAASHAESAKGTHSDLLQILNHENHSWGFSYSSYPHKVRVWYGDKDEKIAENAVRWMEKTMGSDHCTVKVVKGADHSLMYRSTVVVEILEEIGKVWEGLC